jgi:hypothetical protein
VLRGAYIMGSGLVTTMEAVLVRRYVTASGLRGQELLRTRTPKVIRQQSVKSLWYVDKIGLDRFIL